LKTTTPKAYELAPICVFCHWL